MWMIITEIAIQQPVKRSPLRLTEDVLAPVSTGNVRDSFILRKFANSQRSVKACGSSHCKSNRLFEEAATCSNCGGPHAANWRNCLRYPGVMGRNSNHRRRTLLRQRPISHQISCANLVAGIIPKVSVVSVLPHYQPQRHHKGLLPKLANSTCSFKGELCPRSGDCNAATVTPTAGIPPFSMQNTSLTAQTQPVSGPMDCVDIIGELTIE
ncbi:hypothetical protein CEXT_17851 [Caerostris extrusa]|uniref:Uncharacterized protein n=1 Tax=Caerostris extrusa TaxID=172846 RepID=A0AAV4Y4R5_CAEEX|nr:hypothetical protein CEXT_17851 [Caerostris extrusa]